MNALLIVLAFVSALVGLAFVPIRLRVSYINELRATLRVLFVRMQLVPKKPRKPKLKNFRIKRFRRRNKRARKRAQRRELRKLRRTERKRRKSESKNASASPETPAKKTKGPRELFSQVLSLLSAIFAKFPRYLRTEVARLVVRVATEDAAKTAVTYGVTVQSVQYLITLVQAHTDFRPRRDAVISVYPDFLSDSFLFELDFTFRIRLWQVLSLGVSVLMAYLRRDGAKNKPQNSPTATPQNAPILNN